MSLSAFVIFCVFAGLPVAGAPSNPAIRRVDVAGNVRFPTAGILRLLSSAPGKPYSELQAREDLRRLHATGFFREIRVNAEQLQDGRVDVRFDVKEQPYVSELTISGLGAGLEGQVREALRKEKLEPRPATAFDPAAAARLAALVRNVLRSHGYAQPEVRVSAVPDANRNVVRVALTVDTGPKLPVGELEFRGNAHIKSDELLKQVQHIWPRSSWAFWRRGSGYVREELAADLERIRALYRSRGFASVHIALPEINAQMGKNGFLFSGESPRLRIVIPVSEGPVFTLESVSLEGSGKSAEAEIRQFLSGLEPPCRYDSSALDSVRAKIADALGQAGYALADVRVEQSVDEPARSVRATYRIQAGEPAVVGRIRFEGNKRVADRFLRRELATAEGDVFDSSRLDRSVLRLNRSNLVKDIARTDVSMKVDPETRELDITFKVKENDLHGVYGTGGIADGGYLGLIYSAFNLLGIGERISLELDGGAAQSNFLLNMVGRRFLGSPFTIGLSAFHRLTNLNVANLVPDAQDIVHAFRQRSSGIGLSGSYPISTKAQVGLGYQFGRETMTTRDSPGAGYTRGELTPTFVLDSTLDGAGDNGYRAEFARTWAGPASLRRIEAGREAVRMTGFTPIPWTRSRDSLVLRIQGAFAHSGGQALAPGLRFYPGPEIARGFARGGLSAWGLSGPGASSPDLRVMGADAVLGVSAEYRVPISGPLSGSGFLDVGWSALRRSSAQSGGVSLLKKTSSVLRASTGAELRLQLPVIRQPGRLIFAWNPLRLDTLVSGEPPFRLADPRTAIRFALGD